MAGFLNSSIGKKFLMSVSGLFLIIFVGLHATLNDLLLVGPRAYNIAAHFMDTNWMVKIIEPILWIGFLLHIIYAFIVEAYNRVKRPIDYAMTVRRHQSTWVSRNMIWIGVVIFVFLGVHLSEFFCTIKCGNPPQTVINGVRMNDTYKLVVSVFQTKWLVDIVYVLGAIALAMHLHHAFWSAFQTLGWSNDKWRKIWNVIGDIYAVLIGFGFAVPPIYFWVMYNLH